MLPSMFLRTRLVIFQVILPRLCPTLQVGPGRSLKANVLATAACKCWPWTGSVKAAVICSPMEGAWTGWCEGNQPNLPSTRLDSLDVHCVNRGTQSRKAIQRRPKKCQVRHNPTVCRGTFAWNRHVQPRSPPHTLEEPL